LQPRQSGVTLARVTRVLLAFDKFKDALTAQQAGEAVAAALREQQPGWVLDLAPLADGGEGFATILTQAPRGREVSVAATGPRGGRQPAAFGLVPVSAIPAVARAQLQLSGEVNAGATVAVIEMAVISGLALLPQDQRDPWQTATFGTGELMRAAADSGAGAILLGVGGSATNDLGLGALAALGVIPVDAHNVPIDFPVPARWPRIAGFSGRLPAGFPPVYIACDVTNPLLGPRGAAAVYGPQKGLRPADHARLEQESGRIADLLCVHCGQSGGLKDLPGAGAAGGISFGLMAAAGAKLLPGFDLVSAWLDLETKLAKADIVITGEGRFDESSLEGKGPGAVAARALARGKKVHVFAGQVTAAARPGLTLHAITPPGTPLAEALREAPVNLAGAVRWVFAP
jgi:glycerate kinase